MIDPLTKAILVATALLAIGLMLRTSVGVFRLLYLPASVIGGAIGLAWLSTAHHTPTALYDFTQLLRAEWVRWPGTLLAVVFAGLLLDKPAPGGFGAALKRGVRSGVLAWIIVLGQVAIGLLVFILIVKPGDPNVPASYGQLVEVSWAGGPGTAAGMAPVFEKQNFPDGRDLAFFLAMVGLVYGVLMGLAMVNVAKRRGWVSAATQAAALEADEAVETHHTPVGGDVIEPFAVTVMVLAASFGGGVLLQWAWQAATRPVGGNFAQAAGFVPLFLFTLLAGGIVRRTLATLGLERWIDVAGIQKLMGIAMEFLIVAGIATIRLDAVGRHLGPVVLMVLLAAAWSIFCLLVLSPRLLPKAYWFELGLLNFGFSTCNTPQGLMLLRIVDPKFRSGAAADYAVAAPLSQPFVGGGILTFVGLPVLLMGVSPVAVLAGVLALAGLLYVIGRRLGRDGDAVVHLGDRQ